MFGRAAPERRNLAHLEAVEDMVRARFVLSPADLVMVSEDPGRLPGHPPLQTTILFWHDGQRHRLVLFTPVAGVGEADLPPAWLRPGLVDLDGDCC